MSKHLNSNDNGIYVSGSSNLTKVYSCSNLQKDFVCNTYSSSVVEKDNKFEDGKVTFYFSPSWPLDKDYTNS